MKMTSQEFDFLWRSNYPKSIPLPHLFRQDYNAYWFRIKSFPGTRAYPANKKDIKTLLDRQNQLITDVIGNKAPIFGVSGEYSFNEEYLQPDFLSHSSLKEFSFSSLRPIDMYEVSRTEYKPNDIYRPFLTDLVWEPNKYNDLLKAIAFDEIRMFFASADLNCLIAPHDGGIDFIMLNQQIKSYFMTKYKDWLAKPFKYVV